MASLIITPTYKQRTYAYVAAVFNVYIYACIASEVRARRDLQWKIMRICAHALFIHLGTSSYSEVAFLSAKISKNSQMTKFGTQGNCRISENWDNHSTENPGKVLEENQTERKISLISFRKFDSTWKLASNPKHFRKCCHTHHWQFAEIKTRIFHRIEGVLSFLENWHQGIAKQSKFHCCLGFYFDFAYVAEIM